MRWLFLGLFVFIIVGCSTVPIMPGAAKTVNPASYATQDKSHNAEFIVVRDKGFFGGGCMIQIFVNEAKIAELQDGEKTFAWLEPRQYQMTARNPGRGICPHMSVTQNVTLKPDSKTVYRVGISASNGQLEFVYDLCFYQGSCTSDD